MPNEPEAPGTPERPPDAFARMAETRRRLSPQHGVDGEKLSRVLDSAASLQTIHDWAAEMQLGAEGFDNLASARAYSQIQEHLHEAAEALEKAAEILYERDHPR